MEWQKAFNIPEEKIQALEKWCLEGGAERSQQSLLYWALDHKLLSMKEYLQWAKQKYQMPRIKESFFSEQNPNLSFWSQVRKQLPWSQELLPLFQWKNQVFIACLERPKEEWRQVFQNRGFQSQFVLGSIEGMKLWHQKLFSESASPESASQSFHTGPPSNPFGHTTSHINPPSDQAGHTKVGIAEAQKGFYQESEHLSPEVKEAFAEMEKIFEACMVLKFETSTSSLLPWQWNDYCQQMRGEQSRDKEKIDIHEKSIFRIVHRSQQPYHGYIVASPMNQQFFNQWNDRRVPEHITVCPILINRKIAYNELEGMLLGFNNKHSLRDSENCLLLVQKKAQNLVKSLGSSFNL